MSGTFGWNLLYSSVSGDIRNNEDVLVCLTHLVMISNGFQCIGIGDSKNMDGTEEKSETLPTGWNDAYAIRYVFQGRLYNLQGTKLDDGIMINLIRADERNVSLLQLNSSYVVQRHGSLDEMIPNNKDIVKMVKEQLLDKVTISTKTRESTSQTPVQPQSQRESGTRNSLPDYSAPRGYPYSIDPIGVGRNDLDPLGGMIGPRLGSMPGLGPVGGIGPLGPGGGGMLFQPPSRFDQERTGLPQGALPPGARFDPFRPPIGFQPPPRRPNPDNDEFPPPGFDDMYM